MLAPTQEQFTTKIAANNDTGSGKPWFTQNSVKDNVHVQVPKEIPFPPYLAYDAFTSDVPAHVLWERVKCADQDGMKDVFLLAIEFFAAVHVSHTAANKGTVTIAGASFISRPHPDANIWAKERTQQI